MSDLKKTFLERVQAYGCKNEDLAVNYFTRADIELPRMKTPKTWAQIDFEAFVLSAITHANMGIDPFAPKTLYLVPRGNTLCIDLRAECLEFLARNFGINCPENITVELIYSNDKFSMIKKDLSNPQDGYFLQTPNPIDRGLCCGGVMLFEYENTRYNKVRFMSIADINKRTADTSTFYKNYPESMQEKTIRKYAWSKIVLDTTRLSEYYKINPVIASKEFEAENMENLPFDPDAEL